MLGQIVLSIVCIGWTANKLLDTILKYRVQPTQTVETVQPTIVETVQPEIVETVVEAVEAIVEPVEAIVEPARQTTIVEIAEEQEIDLSEKHMLVTGISGSGKSVFNDSLITQVIQNNSASMAHLYMIDMKNGLTFNKYEGVKHIRGIATNLNQAKSMLTTIRRIHHKRSEMFKAMNKSENIHQYNQQARVKLPMIYVFIDEMAQVMSDKYCKEAITQLVQLVRATGIVVVASTQTAGAQTVPTNMRDNFHYKVAFKSANNISAKIAQGNYVKGGLNSNDLQGKGHGLLCEAGFENIEFYGKYISRKNIDKIVDKNK